jgi:hypothetical protein
MVMLAVVLSVAVTLGHHTLLLGHDNRDLEGRKERKRDRGE